MDKSEQYHQAVACISDELVQPLLDPFHKAARSNRWLKSGKIRYLTLFYKYEDNDELIETVETMLNSNVFPKDDNTENKKSIYNMLIDCWQINKVSSKDLEQIIIDYKD